MEVYIEDVLIENFLITYLILHILFLFSKNKKNRFRQVVASMFGSGMALLYPALNLNGAFMFMLKICVGYIITIIAIKTKNIKEQIFSFFMFMFVTAIYGGISLMLSFSVYGNFNGEEKIPGAILIFVMFVVTYLLNQCAKRIFQKKRVNDFVYQIILYNGDCVIKTSGYLDTGNVLCDPNTKEPISLVNSKLFFDINVNFGIMDLLKSNIKKLKNARYINVKTLTGTDKILVFDLDKLVIKNGNEQNIVINPSFALSKVKINEFGCDVVLNANQIKGVQNV